jgi:alkanesulfonate monooxygenase SsuD/methylene tetrahydromethanopterin reductase-like flavin-dependent oxidoreductase (luciferase family)
MPSIAAGRWSILASTTDEAWEALEAWRGLRAPGRLQAVDPEELRRKADEMDRSEILSRYSIVETPEDYIAVYTPLVADVTADVVTIQTTSLDQEATIRLLGAEVLPALREMASSA